LVESLEQDGTRYTLTAFEKANGTLAGTFLPADWTDELFQNIGRHGTIPHLQAFCTSASDLTRPIGSSRQRFARR
jgi:hypothetical protein